MSDYRTCRFVTRSPRATRALAHAFASGLEELVAARPAGSAAGVSRTILDDAATVVMLEGDLGAGKTCFTQGLAAALGVTEDVTSPTFPVLLRYATGRVHLSHFDLYRLETEDELEDVGFFDELESEGVVLIEWGERFPEVLPEERIFVEIARGLPDPETPAVEVAVAADDSDAEPTDATDPAGTDAAENQREGGSPHGLEPEDPDELRTIAVTAPALLLDRLAAELASGPADAAAPADPDAASADDPR